VPHRFALTSTGPLSGKSTLARYLRDEYGFHLANHSYTLVAAFVDTWNSVLPHNTRLPHVGRITVEQVYMEKESWRAQIQTYGYQVGYNDPGRAGLWIVRTLNKWDWKSSVVFDSFRGEVQAQVLHGLGFELVQIEIGEGARKQRAINVGVDYGAIISSMIRRPDIELGILEPDTVLKGEWQTEVQARVLLHKDADSQHASASKKGEAHVNQRI
jgi:hypothetical protein